MIKKLFITCCLLAGFVQSYSQCNPFYSISEGASWEITNYDAKDKIQSRSVNEVLSLDGDDAGWKATINLKSYDKKDKLELDKDIEMECADGVIKMDMTRFMPEESLQAFKDMDMEIETDNLEIPASIDVGDQLPDASIKVTGNLPLTIETKIIDRKVEAQESVTTPAGTFDCYKISYTVTTKTMLTVEFKGVDWIAEGVGMVKTESYKKNGKLMGKSILTAHK